MRIETKYALLRERKRNRWNRFAWSFFAFAIVAAAVTPPRGGEEGRPRG